MGKKKKITIPDLNCLQIAKIWPNIFANVIERNILRSQEGSQYVRGFGGIGGMLRYIVDFQVTIFTR